MTDNTLVIKTILAFGADPLIRNNKGMSCIDLAIERKSSANVINMIRETVINQRLSGLEIENL